MELSDHQNTIFLDRYAKRDKENNVTEDTPEQMWARVAKEISNDDKEQTEFRGILTDFKFVPGGRILAGAGTESEKTYYNCFVIPVETKARRKSRSSSAALSLERTERDTGSDSREAIMDTISTMVDIMSRGGGVGINWSVLRPSNSHLVRVSGTSSGPVGWMNVASAAVGEVIQGGSRRGAAMFMLNDWHPDVEEFLNAKRTSGRIENANISVAVSDQFMEAVRNNGTWDLRFPDTTDPRYNTDWDGNLGKWISAGGRVKVYRTVNARELWESLARSAHASGEPGIVFLDRYNTASTAQGIEDIISVNPCGEQGLGAYSVCNLGSMNLAAYVIGDKFDWTSFKQDVRIAVKFLDNVIDKTFYLHEDSKKRQEDLRRVGLGVMGLADALILLGIRYGSSEAVTFTEHIFSTMKDEAIKESMQLAADRGPAKAWRSDMWERPYLSEFSRRHVGYSLTPLRNLFLLTQAPTGTTAALAGVNSGIEPYFAFEYTRKDRTGTHVIKSDIVDKACCPDVLVTSNDLTVDQHLIMQHAAQKWIDSSVSKTINAPNDATEESVLRAYTMAYDLGLKGLAYYRDGSRSVQVLYREDPTVRMAELEAKIEFLQRQLKVGGGSPAFDKTAMPMLQFATQPNSDQCPVCSSGLIFAEGCQKCSSCTWSAC